MSIGFLLNSGAATYSTIFYAALLLDALILVFTLAPPRFFFIELPSLGD